MTNTPIEYGHLNAPHMSAEHMAEHFGAQMGMQATILVTGDDGELGMQADITASDTQALGMQALINVSDFPQALGMQWKDVDFHHVIHGVHLTEGVGHLTGPLFVERMCTILGMQANITVDQFAALGQEANLIIDIADALGQQANFVIDFEKPLGMQANLSRAAALGMEAVIAIYNTTNVRVLCEFPSRGSGASNWTVNSVEAGDFGIENVDNDIPESTWRSDAGVVTGLQLDNDLGVGVTVAVDTFAIINHNMTTSAILRLQGSNDPSFATDNFNEIIPVTVNNIYYVHPTLPLTGSRYWRLTINDPTNPDGYVESGIILFGAAAIFQGECITDSIPFKLKDFADRVRTEGFTNVANSRALRRAVTLNFSQLNFENRNFRILTNIFETYRTTHKCLWIPTPSATDTELTGRFAVFGKLTELPVARHNFKGGNLDYVDVSFEIDESL